MKVKVGDKVVVIAGKDKGKTGSITKTLKDKDKVVVEENNTNIEKPAIKLSNRGKNLFNISYKSRQLEYVKAILEHEVFNKVFKDCVEFYQMPIRTKIVEYMQEANLYNVNSEETFKRRASTISGWINWILNLYE